MNPTVVSLFAGAGGLDLGFRRAGATILWANDIDKDACATYRLNLGEHIICGDIKDISHEDVPSADIVIGGFPCQGFSRANLRRYKDDERNALYRELLRCIETLRPKVFLAENVRGILSLESGAVAKEILADFCAAGYATEYYVVNAYNYGVPQKRCRVFFVGIRRDLSARFTPPPITHDNPARIKPGDPTQPWVTMSDALKNVPEPSTNCSLKNHIGSQYKVEHRDFTGHRLTDPDQPSPTILARGNGKGGVCALPHPGGHRRLTVRESAIIQSFPDDFEFCGGLMSMYRQIGNAVPVKLAEAFAHPIVELVRSL